VRNLPLDAGFLTVLEVWSKKGKVVTGGLGGVFEKGIVIFPQRNSSLDQ